jgi:hypothetical protein
MSGINGVQVFDNYNKFQRPISRPVNNQPAFQSLHNTSSLMGQPNTDTINLTRTNSTKSLPKVNALRAIFKRLSSTQINEVNRTGKLPQNMMITQNPNGTYRLAWKPPITDGKILGGSQKLPQHLELRKDILGFTRVVPAGYEHFLLKKPQKL